MSTRYAFTWNWADFIRGLIYGTVLILILFNLVSCSSAPSRSFRLSSTIGATQVRGTVDRDSLTGRGSAIGLRGEVAQPVSYFENVEVGLRIGVAGRDAETADSQVDAESGELSVLAVARGLLPVTGEGGLAFYGEGFAGYAHNWGTVKGGAEDYEGNGGGALFGFGAGLDLGTGLTLGLEWSRRDFDIEPIEFRSDDVALVIGGVLRF